MKKAMKLVSLVLAVVMLLGCLTACGSKSATTDTPASTDASNTSSDGGEIVIALISNTTGDYAQYGQPVRDGAMLYINQLNAKGGINGKQVKVLEYDDKGDGVEAVNAYNLACDNGITAVFGCYNDWHDHCTGRRDLRGQHACRLPLPQLLPASPSSTRLTPKARSVPTSSAPASSTRIRAKRWQTTPLKS